MKRSTFRTLKYMNGSDFSKARYMNGVGFEILARTPIPQLPLSYLLESSIHLYHMQYICIRFANLHKRSIIFSGIHWVFVYIEVLRLNQPNRVMSSAASLPNQTFTGQA